MPITSLPPAPSRAEPSTFSDKGDALLGALDQFVTEANALETNVNAKEGNTAADAISTAADAVSTAADAVSTAADAVSAAASAATALAAPGTSATSVTELTVATGSKALTIQTGKDIVVGMSVKIAYTTTPTVWMHGDVTSYNSGTGALVVTVTSILGSGTYTAWTITLSGPAGASATYASAAEINTGTEAAKAIAPDQLAASNRGRVVWSVVTSATNAAKSNGYFCDTQTTAAFTLTLPATPALNAEVQFADLRGYFATNNLTIARNSEKIMGLSENMTVSTNNACGRLVYSGATYGWRLM